MKYLKICLLGLTLLLTACATITGVGTDNTPAPSPLSDFKAQMNPQKIWSTQAGKGTDEKYLNLVPAIDGNNIFTADAKGHVTALSRQNGQKIWQADVKSSLVAGPAAGEGVVLVGGNQADVFALSESTGKPLWHTNLSDQVVAPPVIANGLALVKTLEGQLWALNLSDGKVQWRQAHSVPVMALAGGSRPQVVGNTVIVGNADGKLDAYTLSQGKLLWERAIATPEGASDVEQMVDITANPDVSNSVIYVVTYQGNLAAVSAATGNMLWQQPLSSYTGLALSSQAIFVTDESGVVHAFNRSNGQLLWQLDRLKYRKLTAPVVMGNAIVVGDGEGYLHWLSQSDGSTLARVAVDRGTPIIAAPIVIDNQVYVLDTAGEVASYR